MLLVSMASNTHTAADPVVLVSVDLIQQPPQLGDLPRDVAFWFCVPLFLSVSVCVEMPDCYRRYSCRLPATFSRSWTTCPVRYSIRLPATRSSYGRRGGG